MYLWKSVKNIDVAFYKKILIRFSCLPKSPNLQFRTRNVYLEIMFANNHGLLRLSFFSSSQTTMNTTIIAVIKMSTSWTVPLYVSLLIRLLFSRLSCFYTNSSFGTKFNCKSGIDILKKAQYKNYVNPILVWRKLKVYIM